MASNIIGNTWTLTKTRVRLAMRNRTFLFFSLIMPLGFLFFFVTIFSKGDTAWTAYILGSILTMTVMGSFWGLSVQLVMFREAGILRRFRLAPLGAGPMLASSILSNYILVVPSVAIEILVTKFVLHMQGWGNLWAIFLLVTVGSATFSSFGLIVASVTNTMQETQVINQVIWTAFLFCRVQRSRWQGSRTGFKGRLFSCRLPISPQVWKTLRRILPRIRKSSPT